MTKHKPYNGHKNRAAWNVSMWLDNDYGLYELTRRVLRSARTLDRAAERIYAELEGQSTPDGVKFTLTNIRLAIRGR